MIPINDALKKHVPFHVHEQISNKFPDDPSSLLEGVNYTYKGKTWNFRMDIVKAPDPRGIQEHDTRVYFCAYTAEKIKGCWFSRFGRMNNRVSIHAQHKPRPIPSAIGVSYKHFHCCIIDHSLSKKIEEDIGDLYIDPSQSDLINGVKEKFGYVTLDKLSDKLAIKTLQPIVDFLKDSQKADDSIAPKMPTWAKDDAKLQEFFKSCLQLIKPQAAKDSPPSNRKKEKTTATNKDRKERSYSYGAAFCGILVLLALSYKVGHYVKDKWFSEPKPQLHTEKVL